MRFEGGARLGPYEIIAPLGAGGMGEVYKARDTRLNRVVALKVLPSEAAADPELRARFDREARAISALDHPNICALFDVGHEDGADFLVMQFLEGETLADRLARGRLPLEEAVALGIQIAEALDRAHSSGIVHRDLKPSNVMLTTSGASRPGLSLAKLLDFGIARSQPHPPSDLGRGEADLATRSAGVTRDGVILGTPQYMSPEQVRGMHVDHRADVHAFGMVMYEMLTGARPFRATGGNELIAAILKEHPKAPTEIDPKISPALSRVVMKSLEKEPAARWQSAADLADEMRWITRQGAAAGAPASPQRGIQRREVAAWTIAAAAISIATGAALLSRPVSAPPAPVRFFVYPPEGKTFGRSDMQAALALSPDGQQLAFATSGGGPSQLWVRSLNDLSARLYAGTDSAMAPFWSPDGRYIAFGAVDGLKKIAVSGGPAETISKTNVNAGAWLEDGTIVFSDFQSILRVPSSGGTPEVVVKGDQPRVGHLWPIALPRGRGFIYTSLDYVKDETEIVAAHVDGSGRKPLLHAHSRAVYAEPGYLLYVRDRAVLAQRIDVDRLELTGEPMKVADDTYYYFPTRHAELTASATGALALQPGANQTALEWHSRTGESLGILGTKGDYRSVRLSPDGRHVVFDAGDPRLGSTDIWVLEEGQQTPSRVTASRMSDHNPQWAPDGRRILFSGGAPPHLFWKETSDVNAAEEVGAGFQVACDWSSDDKWVLYYAEGQRLDLFALERFTRKAVTVAASPFDEGCGAFSPNVRRIAYVSNVSGSVEVYVRPFQHPGPAVRVSIAGGSQPRWRRDGQELFYVAPDGRLMAVALRERGDSLEVTAPVPLFQTGRINGYDVSPDGRRFLLNHARVDARTLPAVLMLNWMAALGASRQ